MTETNGFLVYHREQDTEESDAWDDTALVKAYDRAIDTMNKSIQDKEESDHSNSHGPSLANSQHKRNRKKSKKNKKRYKVWQIGDECQAVFTEDGLVYEAKIISVNNEENTCSVRYRGYGNEEEHKLSDLLLVAPKGSTTDVKMDTSEYQGTKAPTPPPRKGNQGKRSSKANSPKGQGQFNPSALPWMPPFAFSPFGPAGASPFAGTHQFPWNTMSSPHHMNLPIIPPPPPLPSNDVIDNSEALCSMLMSWYMSGYHTGYYQGLKSNQK